MPTPPIRRTAQILLFALAGSHSAAQTVMRTPPPPPIDQIGGAGRTQQQSPLRGLSLMLVESPQPKTINIHDKIMIIINETSKQSSDQKLDTKKEDQLKATLNEFPDIMQLLELRLDKGDRKPLTGVDVTAKGKFTGDGKYERNDKFSDKITATVLDVRPNGVLVLEARRTIKKDKEEQTIVLSGECRRDDVTNNNTVLSNQLSDLVIEVQNKGHVKDSSDKGVLTRLFEAIFNF